LCYTGCCAAGGAQSMLIVTFWPDAPDAPVAPDAGVLLVPLEQAAAVRTRPAAAATAIARGRCGRS
jgi:hypothetical protein